MDRSDGSDRVLLTVGVEDYYQVGSFEGLIHRENWYRFETRIARNTRKALDLCDAFGIRATFFVLGWVADAMPEVVREISQRGHEVASGGYWHRTIRQMTPAELREDLRRSREAIERATGLRVLGHRVPHFLRPADLWALDIVAEEGYVYDSSVRPMLRSFAGETWRHTVHRHAAGGRVLWEIPPSSWKACGLALPLAGGNWFRQLPHTLVKPLVRSWHRRHCSPFVMYFHVWELDPGQPLLNTGSLLTRVRHYRNLDKMEWVLKDYFRTFQVMNVAEYLGLEYAAAPHRPEPIAPAVASRSLKARVPVSLVIPCFHEEGSLEYLANTLRNVAASLGRDYDLSFLFVDDGSSDRTWEVLGRLFGSRPDCTLIRHERNRGVAAAILTGIRAAKTEIVCSIDCDCTYDPHGLAEMIPRLADGVDLVTASPYHPEGRVLNVPAWRLSLSRGASFLYRRVLRQKLHTYTSCFRVYRRRAMADLVLREEGFLGVSEILARLDLQGSTVVEHPATLEVRLLGQSKMKVLRSIAGHLRLLVRLAALRLLGRRRLRPSAPGLQPSSSGAHHD
ncbi:MAG TPA: glycosyltransferase [Thermoanaerobaculia bacterium]|nr:glycosyltransferase [Thermoanaerobaculia bacterium]